jgi:hypothetical protein
VPQQDFVERSSRPDPEDLLHPLSVNKARPDRIAGAKDLAHSRSLTLEDAASEQRRQESRLDPGRDLGRQETGRGNPGQVFVPTMAVELVGRHREHELGQPAVPIGVTDLDAATITVKCFQRYAPRLAGAEND